MDTILKQNPITAINNLCEFQKNICFLLYKVAKNAHAMEFRLMWERETGKLNFFHEVDVLDVCAASIFKCAWVC